jgi:2-polyprenyl-3-methyl-5-hydroxy-6-metoxy-1,4-benzoquinol methylase
MQVQGLVMDQPYLADNGADFVYGIDADEHAVKFSNYHFKRKNLKFSVMDIQEISGFPNYFDFIYTSNTLEHLSNIPAFLHKVWRLLEPQGAILIAIPPIINEEAVRVTLANPHHVNAWSPKQWYNILDQYFSEVLLYRHDFKKSGIVLDFSNTPTQTVINEKDFVFKPVPVEDIYINATLTAIFVIRKPRPEKELPSQDR